MLIIVAFLLLFLLPSPWNLVGFLVAIPLWVLELLGWNRTVKNRKKAVGAQTLIGMEGVVSAPCRPVGQIRVNGEIWEARCEAGASPGDRVRVVGRDRLMLIVEAPAMTASGDELPAGAA
ncbi:MAG TPA: NfeD family protein [Gaiellaceae bacterium]|nr:NfeD family protein [Gaiellaceae bacterium]